MRQIMGFEEELNAVVGYRNEHGQFTSYEDSLERPGRSDSGSFNFLEDSEKSSPIKAGLLRESLP
jgi:hypothetical protein